MIDIGAVKADFMMALAGAFGSALAIQANAIASGPLADSEQGFIEWARLRGMDR